MDRNDRPLLQGYDALPDTESSLSDVASDSFSGAPVRGPAAAAVPEDTERTSLDRESPAVSIDLPAAGGRQFHHEVDGASASARWHGRSVLATMLLLMVLSAGQLVIGFMFLQLFIGIPAFISATLGLLVSSGQIMGHIPGDHLEIQVKTVRNASAAATCVNAVSLTLFAILVLILLVSSWDTWEEDLNILVYSLVLWAQAVVFVRVGFQAHSVLRMLHRQST